MKPIRISGVLAVAALAAVCAPSFAGKEKLKPTPKFAKTWESAVEEAKLLNVPIVVHNHGFYCGPCWGMHAAVLQNEKYIKFADKNTVEVIALGRLDEGIEKKEARAATYTVKKGDQSKEYLVEFPGMTVDEMLGLDRSKASTYNHTGKIPYTCLVDPWTEKEIVNWSGGQAAGTIMDAVNDARKQLVKEHGEGVARKDVADLSDAEESARDLTAEGDFAKAIGELAKLDRNAQAWPEALKDRLEKARAATLAAAGEALDKIQAMGAEDPVAAKRELTKLTSKLRGTGLEDRAKELAASLSG